MPSLTHRVCVLQQKRYLQLLSLGLFVQITSEEHVEAVHFLSKVLDKC